jgi:dipeptidyl aminopeptidase/acylaminoacyl peptidase
MHRDRTSSIVLRAVALVLCAHALAAQTAKRPMSIDDIMALRNVGAPAMSPNGASIVFTVTAWEHPSAKGDTIKGDKHDMRSHLWLVSADGSRPPRQLTFSERGESTPAWSRDGSAISFVSARGTAPAGADAPRAQLWLLPLDGGEAEKLTDSKEGVGAYAWSPDGKSIAFISNDSLTREEEAKRTRRDDPQTFEGDMRLSHIWLVDVGTKTLKELVHSTQFTVSGAPAWSPDGTRLTYSTVPTALVRDERRAVFIVNVLTGIRTPIEAGGAAVEGTPAWSPDGTTLTFTTLAQSHKPHGDGMMEREQRSSHLILYDVATAKLRDVADPKQFDDSPGAPRWTPDGKHILFSAGDRAWTSIYDFDVAASTYRKVVARAHVGAFSFSKDGSKVAFTMQTPYEPSDIYAADASFSPPRRLSHMNPQLADIALGETEVITWKSTDGQEVEGILLKPVGYKTGQRYPLLVEPHGGPTGASNSGFKASPNSPGQYWAGRGWATLYPNPRGSTGYGEKFMRGNILDWGGGDYRDIMTGVDAVVARGIADSAKLAVAGWSYGGYMTSWIISQTTRFKAARMGAGLTDLESMYGTTDIPGYIGAFFDGPPNKATLAMYRARSAMTFIENVKTPTLIMHGGNDARVPIGQPMELYRGLKDRGIPTELVFYPREGHGFTEYYHQIDKMRREFDWIAKYTLGNAAVVLP